MKKNYAKPRKVLFLKAFMRYNKKSKKQNGV